MAIRLLKNPLNFPVIGGALFGLYCTLGLAYFETYPPASFQTYLLAGICLMVAWAILSAVYFSRKHKSPLLDGLGTGLLGLLTSGFLVWAIGGIMTEAGLSLDLLYTVFFNLMLVGIHPVLAALILIPAPRNSSPLRKDGDQATVEGGTEQSVEKSALVFDAGSGETVLSVQPEDLILIEAADNYCKLYFVPSGTRTSKLVRMPMKEAERVVHQVAGFYRCHRSYIVNAAYVEKVLGVSQSYRLKVRHLSEEVPVSRSFDITVFRSTQP